MDVDERIVAEAGTLRPDRGQEAEFRALFDEHAGYVHKSLLRLGVHRRDAEDLTHEVFVAVLRRWDAFDASRPPRPWLFAFALRIASSYRQSAYVRRTALEDTEASAEAVAEARVHEQEQVDLVHRALDSLDDAKRVVFVMFELDERPAHEIARELDIPQNTVFSRLRSARHEFADAVLRLRKRAPVRSAS